MGENFVTLNCNYWDFGHAFFLEITIIDPRGRQQFRPEVITILTHIVHTSVRQSPLSKSIKTNQIFTAGRYCGLAEWIIDDSCLVTFNIFSKSFLNKYDIHTHVKLKINDNALLAKFSCSMMTTEIWRQDMSHQRSPRPDP